MHTEQPQQVQSDEGEEKWSTASITAEDTKASPWDAEWQKTGGICALWRLHEALTEKAEAHPGTCNCHPYLMETEKDLSEETPREVLDSSVIQN